MDIKNIVNTICLIAGICVIIFGVVTAMGMIGTVPSGKAMAPIILGAVIVIWSAISLKRNR